MTPIPDRLAEISREIFPTTDLRADDVYLIENFAIHVALRWEEERRALVCKECGEPYQGLAMGEDDDGCIHLDSCYRFEYEERNR